MELVGNDKILKLLHADAVAEGLDPEAGDQVGSGFGNGDDLPAVILLELFENTAYKRGFACGGSAGEDDASNILQCLLHPCLIIMVYLSISCCIFQ